MAWSKKLIQIPAEIARYCEVFSHMHNDMAMRHNKYYTWLTVIQVILQSYTAIVIASISQSGGDKSGPLSISGLIAAIGGAICSGIESRFNLRVSTHKNKQYGSAYSKLQRNIRVKLVTQKGDVAQFINWASTQYDVLSAESPNIDEDIVLVYAKKHTNLNLYYPGFIRDENGDRLDELHAETPVNPETKSEEKHDTQLPGLDDSDEEKVPTDLVGIKLDKHSTLKRFSTELPSGTPMTGRRHSASEHNRRATWVPDNKSNIVRSITPPAKPTQSPQKFQGRETSQEDVELGMLMRNFNSQFNEPFEDPRPL